MRSPIRFILSLCLLLGTGASVTAQTPAENAAWFKANFTKKEVMIRMRDGIKLHTVLYIPKDASKTKQYPILMERTPYNSEPYGADTWPAGISSSQRKVMEAGYIIAKQDVRGRWGSQGEYDHVRPLGNNLDKKAQTDTDEATDTYDTVEWLVRNVPESNKRVGFHGVSYPGFYATTAALSSHPAVKAVSPQAPVTEWFIGDDVHHGGALFWMDFFYFLPYFQDDVPGKAPRVNYRQNVYGNRDNYRFFLDSVKTPLRVNTVFWKDTISFWKDVLAHPDYDSYWKSRNPIPKARDVKPAVLTVGGWYDAEDLYGALKTYEGIEKQNPAANNKLVMGPWCHGCWWGPAESLGSTPFGQRTGDYYIDSLFLPFMNYHLKNTDKKAAPPAIAEATVFEGGTNRWRKFDTWPPKGTQMLPFFLLPGELLAQAAPSGKGPAFSEYVSDPANPVPYQGNTHWGRTSSYMIDDQRFANTRPDVLSFYTQPLAEDVTLAGPVIADLIASISTTDADFVVKLIDVYPNDAPQSMLTADARVPAGGYEQLVRAEILRGRYRYSWEKPSAFTPNAPTPVKVTLPDVMHTFRKGHRILVQVQSSWFPLADRNPQQFINVYQAQPEDYIKSTIRIHHGPDAASRIQLPVLR